MGTLNLQLVISLPEVCPVHEQQITVSGGDGVSIDPTSVLLQHDKNPLYTTKTTCYTWNTANISIDPDYKIIKVSGSGCKTEDNTHYWGKDGTPKDSTNKTLSILSKDVDDLNKNTPHTDNIYIDTKAIVWTKDWKSTVITSGEKINYDEQYVPIKYYCTYDSVDNEENWIADTGKFTDNYTGTATELSDDSSITKNDTYESRTIYIKYTANDNSDTLGVTQGAKHVSGIPSSFIVKEYGSPTFYLSEENTYFSNDSISSISISERAAYWYFLYKDYFNNNIKRDYINLSNNTITFVTPPEKDEDKDPNVQYVIPKNTDNIYKSFTIKYTDFESTKLANYESTKTSGSVVIYQGIAGSNSNRWVGEYTGISYDVPSIKADATQVEFVIYYNYIGKNGDIFKWNYLAGYYSYDTDKNDNYDDVTKYISSDTHNLKYPTNKLITQSLEYTHYGTIYKVVSNSNWDVSGTTYNVNNNVIGKNSTYAELKIKIHNINTCNSGSFTIYYEIVTESRYDILTIKCENSNNDILYNNNLSGKTNNSATISINNDNEHTVTVTYTKDDSKSEAGEKVKIWW